MAGIGWKLQRMVEHGSLMRTTGAYLTGVAVTSAPWLLTTAVLMSMRVLERGDASPTIVLLDRIVTLVYAVTVILSAPVNVVVSRYTADRLYDRRLDRIAAPLWRALASTLTGALAVGVVLMVMLRAPPMLAVAGVMLTVVVAAQWLLLSVGGGMSSPLVVLQAFCAGAPLSLVAALCFYRGLGLGAVGYLMGFTAGQFATLVLLLRGVTRAIPDHTDEEARLLPAFAEYRLLAISSLTYYLSIWADKAVVWLLHGSDVVSVHLAVASIAWFTVVPAFGWIYVQIETVFYRRFRSYYRDLGGGAPLSLMRERAFLVRDEANRILRGAVAVQAMVLLLALAAAPILMRLARLPDTSVFPFRLAAAGASFQLTCLLELLLLYYLDLRQDAVAVSALLLLSELALVTSAHLVGLPPTAGYALACVLTAGYGFLLVRARLATLLLDTFQAQPYGNSI